MQCLWHLDAKGRNITTMKFTIYWPRTTVTVYSLGGMLEGTVKDRETK